MYCLQITYLLLLFIYFLIGNLRKYLHREYFHPFQGKKAKYPKENILKHVSCWREVELSYVKNQFKLECYIGLFVLNYWKQCLYKNYIFIFCKINMKLPKWMKRVWRCSQHVHERQYCVWKLKCLYSHVRGKKIVGQMFLFPPLEHWILRFSLIWWWWFCNVLNSPFSNSSLGV